MPSIININTATITEKVRVVVPAQMQKIAVAAGKRVAKIVSGAK